MGGVADGVRGCKGERVKENKLLFFFRERKEERERFSPLPSLSEKDGRREFQPLRSSWKEQSRKSHANSSVSNPTRNCLFVLFLFLVFFFFSILNRLQAAILSAKIFLSIVVIIFNIIALFYPLHFLENNFCRESWKGLQITFSIPELYATKEFILIALPSLLLWWVLALHAFTFHALLLFA